VSAQRPWGFREFVRARNYCSLYLLSGGVDRPIKIGVTDDPHRRLRELQIAHYEMLEFHRVWWLAGQSVAARLEAAFKLYFLPEHVRGEWYEVDPEEAVAFLEETIGKLGTWGLSQDQIEMKMIRGVAHRYEMPFEAPRSSAEAAIRGLRTLKGRSRRF
jgi:Meiotically up-regulated gene 113